MSIADTLINVIIFTLNNTILTIFPIEISYFPLTDFSSLLNNISGTFSYTFGFLQGFVPIALLFQFLFLVIFCELALIGFKIIKFVINIIRGSGA
jgi:hypothetical protein